MAVRHIPYLILCFIIVVFVIECLLRGQDIFNSYPSMDNEAHYGSDSDGRKYIFKIQTLNFHTMEDIQNCFRQHLHQWKHNLLLQKQRLGYRPAELPPIRPSRNRHYHKMREHYKQYIAKATGSPTLEMNQDVNENKSVFFRINLKELSETALRGDPLHPLPEYKCPCWISGGNDKLPQKQQQVAHQEKLLCFPLVYIIGVVKSGTSDLWITLRNHSDAVPTHKELSYWGRGRLWSSRTVSNYVARSAWASKVIQDHPVKKNGTLMYNKFLGDGSPAYFWDYDGWHQIPGNNGLLEPRYTLAHTLRAVVPMAKLVLILRDPATRLYSHFRMKSGSHVSPRLFHAWTIEAVNNTVNCFSRRTVRSCAYDMTLSPYEHSNPGGMFLRAGLYAVFLRDWLEVFPRNQLFIFHAENYYSNRSSAMEGLFKFLGVTALSQEQMEQLDLAEVNNKRHYEPIMEETREILYDFYYPFNSMLSNMLGSKTYSWKMKN